MEHSFQVGDMVFLRLSPYRKYSLKVKGDYKLHPRFYGPYRVTRKVGELAYELIKLPEGIQIHNVFHVSCLKKAIEKRVVASKDITPIYYEGHLEFILEEIL